MSEAGRCHDDASAIVALVLGMMIGGAAADDQAALDKANARIQTANGKITELAGERDQLASDLDSTTQRAETAEASVKQLTAKAEVPDFTGDDASEARTHELVEELGLEREDDGADQRGRGAGYGHRAKPERGKSSQVGTLDHRNGRA